MTLNQTAGRRARQQSARAARDEGVGPRASREERPALSFRDWLRVQLRARRMSQRQLATRSGISHATISRILNEDREPGLDTATRLAEVLLDLHGRTDDPRDVALLSSIGAADPAKRVEHALRADSSLDAFTVRRVMDYYLAVRQAAGRPRERPA